METNENLHIRGTIARIEEMRKEVNYNEIRNLNETTDTEDEESYLDETSYEHLNKANYSNSGQKENVNDASSSIPLNINLNIDLDDLPTILYGKNNYKWSTKTPEPKTLIVKSRIPTGKGEGISVRSPLESWALFINDEMLFKIVIRTNEKIFHLNRNSSAQTHAKYTDLQEIQAFVGLLYFSGLQGNRHFNIEKLWSSLSSPIYRMTMPSDRFTFLLRNIRFDDKSTRSKCKATDKLASIRELWDQLLYNCSKYYTPGENCTIDEQLLCIKKPNSSKIFGDYNVDVLKVMSLNDTETFYMYNALILETPMTESSSEHCLCTLCRPLYGSSRNVTCDKWFISVPIVDKFDREYNLTTVGTIKKDEPEIPICMTKARAQGSSMFAYDDNKTLVSYCPRENKVILLLSSLHEIGKINPRTNVPEIIEYYNGTKNATDVFNQMCELYTTARYTQRWPSRFFYAMLDMSGINSYVLYQLNRDNTSKSRYTFLEELAYELIKPLLGEKMVATALHSERCTIKNILEDFTELQKVSVDDKLVKCTKCGFCGYKKHANDILHFCPICKKSHYQKHKLVNSAPDKL